MKRANTIKTLTCAVVASFTPVDLHAREAVVALSPFGTVEEKMAEIQDVATHFLETVDPGETAWVVNGYNQEQIAQYALPDDPERYKNVRSRMRDNAAFFQAMKRFAEAAHAPEGDAFADQIDFPGFMRTVGANYPAENARDLILYGVSPITDDPRTPDLSTKDGVIPDDDHIAASRADSTYGAAEEGTDLANYIVHWGMNSTGWSVSDRHAYFMQRFMALSVSARGGTLATFAPDPETALRNAKSGISASVGDYTLDTDGQRTMVHFQPLVDLPQEAAGLSIYDRVLSTRTPDSTEVRSAENVEIAIRWECDCDFDLAVQVWGADIISYRNQRGTSGTLFKDFTSSQSLNNGWETVALPGPVDLQAMTVAVNKFSGGHGGIEAELRIAIDGETWGRRLNFTGAADGGAGFGATMSRRAPANPSWVVVQPTTVVEGN